LTHTREGSEKKRSVIKNYYTFELEKKTKRKMLNEYIVDRHEFLLCTFIAKRMFAFVEVEKCGFVRIRNARRFTNEAATFY
jgi:hypothetical protein